MACFSEILSRRSYSPPHFQALSIPASRAASNGHPNYRAKVETVADAPALIVDTRMAHCVGINPAGAGFTDDLRHSIEHARSGLDVHTRIAEKEDIGIGSVEESLNTCG